MAYDKTPPTRDDSDDGAERPSQEGLKGPSVNIDTTNSSAPPSGITSAIAESQAEAAADAPMVGTPAV